MNGMNLKPQMTQMDADVFPYSFICANLRHLRFNHLSTKETDNACGNQKSIAEADDEELKAIEDLEKDLKRKGKGDGK